MARAERSVVQASLLGVVAAVLAAASPVAIRATVLVAFLALLPRSALFRAGFLLFGGLATLHSGVDDLTADKLVYAIGVALAAGMALFQAVRSWRNEYNSAKALWPFLAAFALLSVVSLPVALSQDTAASDWLRDVSAYVLVALVPLFVVDLARSSPNWRVIAGLFAPAAVAATITFTLEWLFLRHVVSFDAAMLLSSFFLPAALFALCISGAVLGSDRWLRVVSLLGALGVMLLLFATGTRSSVVLFAGAMVCLVAVVTIPGRSSKAGYFLGLVTVVSVVTGGIVVVALTNGTIGSRLRNIPNVVTEPTSDPSYRLREKAWRAGWKVFEDKPLTGAGAGYRFVWQLPGGRERSGYNIDSPLGFPAKFGLVGLVLLIVALVVVGRFLIATYRVAAEVPWWASVSFCAMVLLWTPLGVPFEDKGMSFGLLWLLAMVAVSADRPQRRSTHR